MFHIFLSFTLAKWAWFYPWTLGVTSFVESVGPGTISSRCYFQDILSDYPYNHATLQSASYAFLTYSENYLHLWKRSCPSPILCFVPSLFDGSIPRTLQAAPAKANGSSSPRNEAPVEAHGFLQVLVGRWTFTRGTSCSVGNPISWWFGGSLLWLWPRLAEVCWSSL